MKIEYNEDTKINTMQLSNEELEVMRDFFRKHYDVEQQVEMFLEETMNSDNLAKFDYSIKMLLLAQIANNLCNNL